MEGCLGRCLDVPGYEPLAVGNGDRGGKITGWEALMQAPRGRRAVTAWREGQEDRIPLFFFLLPSHLIQWASLIDSTLKYNCCSLFTVTVSCEVK